MFIPVLFEEVRHQFRRLFVEDVIREFADFFLRVQQGHVHLAAHGSIEDCRHALAHRDLAVITRKYLIVAVYVFEPVLGAYEYAVAVRPAVCACVRFAAHHVRPYAVDICRMRVIHHVGDESAGRPHVDLQSYVFTGFGKTFAGLREFEEFKMHEAAPDLEALQGSAAVFAQLIRHFGNDVYDSFRVVVD